jgi:MATE family multidrug resistance protein
VALLPEDALRPARERRWSGKGGYREVLALAAPLIVSTGSLALQEFVDRMFLSWYSPASIAAAMPAGILYFTLLAVFLGTASYVSTFVAQYQGARQFDRIGPSLWQGLYVALAGGLLMVLLSPLAAPLFSLIGHPLEVQRQESAYFRVLCYGSFFPIANTAVSAFYSGRGKPWPVMWANLAATGANIFLNSLLIFGRWGLPELGIVGAAISTCVAGAVALLVLLVLFLRPDFERLYRVRSAWKPDGALLRRLLRFGLPSGVQFFIDIFGFTVFILLIGRVGTIELAATNIAFNINALAFMPMIGLGTAISILVGQYIGERNVPLAERSVYSGAILCFAYMGLLSLAYVLVPGFFVRFFAPRSSPEAFLPIRTIAVVLLRFVALYSLFDTMNIVFASAIKGAGDTRFVMIMILVLSVGVLIVPTYLALVHFRAGVYRAWIFVSAYIMLLGLGFLVRFLRGKWKTMSVI